MKWTNRQYVDLMTYNHPERPMFSELFGPIVGLAEEWRAQGATEDQIAMRGFAFDYVPYYQLRASPEGGRAGGQRTVLRRNRPLRPARENG